MGAESKQILTKKVDESHNRKESNTDKYKKMKVRANKQQIRKKYKECWTSKQNRSNYRQIQEDGSKKVHLYKKDPQGSLWLLTGSHNHVPA